MKYTTITGKSPNTPELVPKYSLVEVDSSTGTSNDICRYVNPSGKSSDTPILRDLGSIFTIEREKIPYAVSYSKDDMKKIFDNKETRKFAFRVHDAGDHLFLVVNDPTDEVLLQRVVFGDLVDLGREKKRKKQIKSQETIDVYAALKESVEKMEHYGWIYEEFCRCGSKPYILVPCLMKNPIQWVVQGKLIHGNGRLCC
jgi:hypothetical protein